MLHGTGEGGAPRPVRSWRALWVLLLLVPVTLHLAAPHPAHAGGDHASEQGVHGLSPADLPACHHDPAHGSALTLPGDRREVDNPAPGDSLAALPSEGPFSRPLPATGAVPAGPLPAESLPSRPLYLLTRRLRI